MELSTEILLRERLVEVEHVHAAREVQSSSGGILLDILVKAGRVTQDAVAEVLQRRLGIPYFGEISLEMIDAESLARLSPEQCRSLEVLPIRLHGGEIYFAMADPTDLVRIDDIRFITGLQVEPALAPRDAILAIVSVCFKTGDFDDQVRQLEPVRIESAQTADETLDLNERRSAEQPPVIALVNLILKQAIEKRASDIHLEPKEKGTRLRYRIDGVLTEKGMLPASFKAALTSRIKVLCDLDIAEKRTPQDGSFTVTADGRRVDFRVSTFPTLLGEKVVMRLLDKTNASLGVNDLGFPQEVGDGIRAIMSHHEGIFLVTGPTGSGKSTTLYTLLRSVDNPGINIVTLEDPIEYQLETITQGQANPKAGFTFAAGLRSILRQDPDVILVGEIRDLETARIAVQASLTGHFVFSTLHTNSAAEVVIRLTDMGLEPFMIAAALRGALAQRLARRLCRECREPYEAPDEIRELFAANSVKLVPGAKIYRAVGCPACEKMGYKGRLAVYELFRMTEDLKRMISRGTASGEEYSRALEVSGYRTLREDGLRKVRDGLTSVEEIYRVT